MEVDPTVSVVGKREASGRGGDSPAPKIEAGGVVERNRDLRNVSDRGRRAGTQARGRPGTWTARQAGDQQYGMFLMLALYQQIADASMPASSISLYRHVSSPMC